MSKYFTTCRVRCKCCGDILEYKNRSINDNSPKMLWCSCGKVGLDPAAIMYRVIGSPENYEDLSEQVETRKVIMNRGSYISNQDWLQSAVGGTELVLRKVSTLEYLNMFVGYFNEQTVDVYCSSDGIDYFRDGDVLCCTFEQAVNDIMADWDNADVQALTEALSNYYYQHNKSFDGLNIRAENAAVFDEVKEWAKKYYKTL